MTRDLETLDTILHEAALVEAERGTSTPAQRQIARQVRDAVDAQLAALRRKLLPDPDPPTKAPPIRPSLFALGREALVARLEELTRSRGGAVQYAHRELAGLSDDDLRRLIDLLEPNAD